MPPFSTILIANRGEIAVRIIRTARSMGYRTVAVYSEADANALHVKTADHAICIGAPPPSASYLNISAIIHAAKQTNAQAIHPGYGFLSENSTFSQACADANLIFIGPTAATIAMMGNKAQAKRTMSQAGVPCIPGYHDTDQSDTRLQHEADRIGYPLLIKASAGGGGRGMRVVHQSHDFLTSLQTARSEALNAFGSAEVILEKYIAQGRHIEVQIMADTHGHCIHLGERECSIQRRHQKIIEESPSPSVPPDVRHAITQAAVTVGKTAHYTGAGTVEFLMDERNHFYFLEMNTRLQVEHPITEMRTGLDLVAWQLRIASGEPLPVSQDHIQFHGHAIEARLCAEDPHRDHLPQTGVVAHWHPANAEGIRVDGGIQTGQPITAYYDSMLAKVIAFAPDRDTARMRLVQALRSTTLFGVITNKAYLASILEQPAFIQGHTTTAFLVEHADALRMAVPTHPSPQDIALAAVLLTPNTPHPCTGPTLHYPWILTYSIAGEPHTVRGSMHCPDKHHYAVHISQPDQSSPNITHLIRITHLSDHTVFFTHNATSHQRTFHRDPHPSPSAIFIQSPTSEWCFAEITHIRQPRIGTAATEGRIKAMIDGRIASIRVKAGDAVQKGDILAVIEAMKMENPLRAPFHGIVDNFNVQIGEFVRTGQTMGQISAA